MKFYHLVNSVETLDVCNKIQEIYEFANEPEAYKSVLETLRSLKHSNHNEFTICIDYVTDPKYLAEGEKPYYDMYGLKKGDETQTHYALDFESWSNWLNMDISKDSLDKFDYDTILAVCLWEMTFHGYTEEEIASFKYELDEETQAVRDNKDEWEEFNLEDLDD